MKSTHMQFNYSSEEWALMTKQFLHFNKLIREHQMELTRGVNLNYSEVAKLSAEIEIMRTRARKLNQLQRLARRVF